MINTIKIISKKEFSYLLKEKTFLYAVGIFIVMAILSTVIWWASQHTVLTVYNYAVEFIKAPWQVAPPLALKSDSSLLIVKNMIIYNALVWTLVAIIMWYYVWINDRLAWAMKLILSRPVKLSNLFLAKASSIALLLLILSIISFLITIISLTIFNAFSVWNLISVSYFYMISYLYILWFWFIGLWFSFFVKDTWIAILYSLILWIIITFVLPELSSALYPTSSLNPILPDTQVLQSSWLQLIHNISFPFSVWEHYKHLSGEIIGINNTSAPTYYKNDFYDYIILILRVIVSFIFSFIWVKRYKEV